MLRTFFSSSTVLRSTGQRWRPTFLSATNRGLKTTIPRPVRYKRFSDESSAGTASKHPLDWRRWDPPVKFGVLLVGTGGIYYLAHLEQVPETGRWRFMNTSTQTEAQLGEMLNKDMKERLGDQILPTNHPLSIHVRKVTSRLLQHSNLGRVRGQHDSSFAGRLFGGIWTPEDDYPSLARATYGPDKEWDVIVVNDRKTINASASPGLITVYTGILPVCKDEQGLAAVLAHEIGHVVARHSAERISAQTVTFALVIALQALGIDSFVSLFVDKYLLNLPNSRTQELEADLIGLRLMSRACYDPKSAPEMFERLGKLGNNGNDFFQTHPSSERRIKQLEEALPEAYSILKANPQCEAIGQRLDQLRERQREIFIKDNGSWESS